MLVGARGRGPHCFSAYVIYLYQRNRSSCAHFSIHIWPVFPARGSWLIMLHCNFAVHGPSTRTDSAKGILGISRANVHVSTSLFNFLRLTHFLQRFKGTLRHAILKKIRHRNALEQYSHLSPRIGRSWWKVFIGMVWYGIYAINYLNCRTMARCPSSISN